MRLAAIALWVGLGSSAHAETALPVWRLHTENLAQDRERAHACLSDGAKDCTRVVQDACLAPYDDDARSEIVSRLCDWRAIAAWEDEMNATLATLRTRLKGANLTRLNASQRAWHGSMLADVALVMDYYAGGSLSGPVGAQIRARATAARAAYLDAIAMMTDDQ